MSVNPRGLMLDSGVLHTLYRTLAQRTRLCLTGTARWRGSCAVVVKGRFPTKLCPEHAPESKGVHGREVCHTGYRPHTGAELWRAIVPQRRGSACQTVRPC